MLRQKRSNRFARWLLRLVVWLLPLCAVWWWLGGAEWALRALRLLADTFLPHLMFDDVRQIVLQENQSWKVRTRLEIVSSGAALIIFLSKETLRHIVLGFPLLWALLLATPGRWKQRLVIGTALMVLLSLLGIAAHLWAHLAVVANHRPSVIDENLAPPPFLVSATPYPDWLFHLSSFAHYLAVLILPIIGPVLIWVALCPRELLRLVLSLRRRMNRSQQAAPSHQ